MDYSVELIKLYRLMDKDAPIQTPGFIENRWCFVKIPRK
jgi:hypothetical protein